MAKYLLSYDEQDVKNGKLDVSPDGVFRGVPEKITPKVTIDIRPDGLGSYVADTTFLAANDMCINKSPAELRDMFTYQDCPATYAYCGYFATYKSCIILVFKTYSVDQSNNTITENRIALAWNNTSGFIKLTEVTT